MYTEIKFSIARAKAAFNKKMTQFINELDLKLRKKLLTLILLTWRIW